MTEQLLTPQLSRAEALALRNKRTGLALFQLSWIFTFVVIAIVNFWFRGQAAQWPPSGVQVDALIPTLMTLALVVSSVFARRGLRGMKADDRPRFVSAWRVTLALGVLFAIVMAVEFVRAPGSGLYLSVYRLMIGYHHAHAMVILFYLWRVYRAGAQGAYSSRDFWPVEGGTSLWDFVTVAWVAFYLVLYII